MLKRNPKDAGAYGFRSSAYGHKGDYDRAIADINQAIMLLPNKAVAYWLRGSFYAGKDEYDRAIADYDHAIELDPKHAEAYVSRGMAHYSKGENRRAIADLDQAIKLDPKDATAFFARGAIHDREDERDRAIADYGQAIGLDPNNALAYWNRGFSYARKGEFDRAIADYDQAIRLDPKGADVYSLRGQAYAGKGEYDRAIADYDKAVRLDPKNSGAYSHRGQAYAGRGEYDRAIADYEEAIRLNPTSTAAREDLAGARQAREHAHAALTAARPTPAVVPQPASPPAASPSRRVALVIGNSSYRSVPALPNPRRDAEAVADALRQTGFETVELAEDLDREGMVKALRTFRDQADKADWALVYFAGHGIEINRVNYLIPVDATLADDRDVKAQTVSYEELLEAIDGARALRLVILDACRDNPFKARMRRTTASRGSFARGLAPPPEMAPGTLVVYSAKEGEVAADDVDGVNSPFARAFVKQLTVPGREIRRLFDYVRDDVLRATGSRQQPYTYGSLPGERDFFFVSAQ